MFPSPGNGLCWCVFPSVQPYLGGLDSGTHSITGGTQMPREFSEAHKQALREASKRRWARADEHRTLTDEHKRKIGEANRGRKRSKATRRQMRKSALRRWARVRAERDE